MTRARLSAWHRAVFSALGIGTLVNCGGVSEHSDEPDGSEGGSAGVSATGGIVGTGGSVSGGVGGAAGSAPGGVGGGPRNVDFQRCTDPMPLIDYIHDVPVETGLVQCAGGWVHRPARGECPSTLPRAEGVGAVESGCTSDADCTERPEGWCYRADPNPSYCGAPSGRHVGQCQYGCVRDENCASGTICTCFELTGQCVPSGCATDADCNGFLCASRSTYGPFTCQTASDECMTDADCPGGRCNEARRCEALPSTGAGGTCGRPFLVAGEARTADALGGPSGWFRSVNPDIRKLSSTARARLAEHWTELARMEHASVAAFARFTLELVSLGAPAALVEASQQAMGDEIEHARLCFGLASAYAEREIGPGRLAVEGALDDRSFETIVRTAILEACVGETLAAVEAEDAAERATDPEVRRVLAHIARDEARHAELGFRFLGWALGRAEPALRERLARALGDAVRSELAACDALLTRADDSLSKHGMPSNAERRTVRELALREIVEPAARSLSVPN